MMIDIIELIIAGVALIVSIIVAVYSAKKSAKLDFEKELYSDILRKELQEDWPNLLEATFNTEARRN